MNIKIIPSYDHNFSNSIEEPQLLLESKLLKFVIRDNCFMKATNWIMSLNKNKSELDSEDKIEIKFTDENGSVKSSISLERLSLEYHCLCLEEYEEDNVMHHVEVRFENINLHVTDESYLERFCEIEKKIDSEWKDEELETKL